MGDWDVTSTKPLDDWDVVSRVPQARNAFDQFDAKPSKRPVFAPDAKVEPLKPVFAPDAPIEPLPSSPRNNEDITWHSPKEDITWDSKPANAFDEFDSKPGKSWSDVGSEALQNIPASAGRFASDMAQPFLHPIDTASNLGNVGLGLMNKAGLGSGHEQYADAVGRFFADRYGGIENFKKTLAEDPVGVAGDLSMLFTGGESALARAPGIAGRVGEIAGTTARAIDPLTNAGRLAKGAGWVGEQTLGGMTGAGPAAIREAATSGYEGGEAGRAFRENMRGTAPVEDAVIDARNAVQQMRKERGTAYTDAMTKIGADKTILSWNDVDTALADMDKVATFKGQSLSPSTEAMRNKIRTTVDDWKNLQASEFWTPEGFDALKKRVGDLRDATQYGTPERVVADQAYHAIRKTIVDQAPDYARAMKGYEQASALIKEMETTLSANRNAPVARTLGKLQKVLRDNVTTQYGRQKVLADYLVANGATNLMEKLAGQALGSWAPRGWPKLVATEAGAAAAGLAGAGLHGAGLGALAPLPFMSPRLVGEVTHGAARAARAVTPLSVLARPAWQVGRISNATE